MTNKSIRNMVEEVRKLDKERTQGDWRLRHDRDRPMVFAGGSWSPTEDLPPIVHGFAVCDCDGYPYKEREESFNNADFIASAPTMANLINVLVDKVDVLRKALRSVEGQATRKERANGAKHLLEYDLEVIARKAEQALSQTNLDEVV